MLGDGCERLQQDALTEILLDNLVGTEEQRLRKIEADGASRLQVDHELEPVQLFHWKLGRIGALEDAVNK